MYDSVPTDLFTAENAESAERAEWDNLPIEFSAGSAGSAVNMTSIRAGVMVSFLDKVDEG